MIKQTVQELRHIIEYLEEINADKLQRETMTRAADQLERLTQMLKECSPFEIIEDEELSCIFCNAWHETGLHSSSCEYINAIK